jgi:hypothetical protein
MVAAGVATSDPVAAGGPVAYGLVVRVDTAQVRPLAPVRLRVSFFLPSSGWSSRLGQVSSRGDTIAIRIDAHHSASQVDLQVLVPQTIEVSTEPLTPGPHTVIATVQAPFCIMIFPPPPGCGFASVQTLARFGVPAPPDSNRAPLAAAGPDLHLAPGDTARIDGSASLDADGDSLRYRWRVVPPLVLSDSTAATIQLTAPATPGVYPVVLAVDDGWVTGATDTLMLFVDPAGRPPSAVCGGPQRVRPISAVQLDGTASSDPDGDTLAYHWAAPSGVVLRDSTTARPTFCAPAAAGDYAFVLTVDDGHGGRATDTVLVTVASMAFHTYTYDLPPSWNMVSLPVTLVDSSLAGVLPRARSLFRFAGVYEPETCFAPGKGYWADLGESHRISVHGPAHPDTALVMTLPVGWSMVGPGTVPLDVGALRERFPELISVFGFAGEYQNAQRMEPGQAYWVNLSAPMHLDLSGRVAASPTGRPAAMGPTEPSRPAVWVDGSSNSQALELGEAADQVIELPPSPPVGLFDVRVDVADGVQAWQVPAGDGPYRVRVQGGVQRLRWEGLADRGWEVSVDGTTVPLVGSGEVAMSDRADVELRHVATALPATVLLGAWPNPFNPTTSIRYRLAQGGDASLSVYAVTGQRVRQLIAGYQTAGSHQVTWDGRDGSGAPVGNGVYLAELAAGPYRAVRPMVLMK